MNNTQGHRLPGARALAATLLAAVALALPARAAIEMLDPTPAAAATPPVPCAAAGDADGVAACERTSRLAAWLSREAAAEGGGNRVLSPLSLAATVHGLGLLTDGRTRRELAQFLGVRGQEGLGQIGAQLEAIRLTSGAEGTLQLADVAFVSPRLSLAGAELSPEVMAARVRPLDFAAADAVDKVNAWASEQTKGLVPTIVDRLAPESALVVANALYYRGTWARPFAAASTREGPFQARGQQAVQVPLMRDDARVAPYLADGDLHAIRLPFTDSQVEYIVITSKSRRSAKEMLAALGGDGAMLARFLRASSYARYSGRVVLPRHDIDHSAELREELVASGVASLFSECADFSPLTREAVRVDRVVQRARLKVDEAGAEAAAVTAAVGVRSMVEPPRAGLRFEADRPFIGVLVHAAMPDVPLVVAAVEMPK